MKKIKYYLDAAKKEHDLSSDYALAKKLQVGQSHISNYNSARSYPDDKTAVKLARLLNINPLEIIAAAHYHRAAKLDDPKDKKKDKKLWLSVYKQAVGKK